MKKTCSKCGISKFETEYYKHYRMASGLLGTCKECIKKGVRENYAKKRDQYMAYEKSRAQSPERKKKKIEYQSRSRINNPIKKRARDLVQIHIKSGRLKRPDHCTACMKKCTPEAHHEDYKKPLEVEWLCFYCHRSRHGQIVADRLK